MKILNKESKLSAGRFLWKVVTPYKWWLFAQIANASFWSIQKIFSPYLLKILLENLLDFSRGVISYGDILKPALLFLGIDLLLGYSHLLHDFFWLHIRAPLRKDLSNLLMNRMMKHSQSVYQQNFSGGLGNRIKDTVHQVPLLIEKMIDRFWSDGLALLLGILLFFHINIYFSIGLLLWLVFSLIIAIFTLKKAKKLSLAVGEANTDLMGRVVDIFSNMDTVRLFVADQFEIKNINKSVVKHTEAYKREKRFWAKAFFIQGYLFMLYNSACFLLLMYLYKKRLVTAGDFILVFNVNTSLISMLWGLAKDINRSSTAIGLINQGLKIALQPFDITDSSNAKKLKVKKGEIQFNQVSFNYPGTASLFNAIKLTIPARQKVGLVGYSGGGKSTFINLILRIFDTQKGDILIDGMPIKKVTQDSLHSSISIVSQEPILFHRTLLENIRYGNPEAANNEVYEAAKNAYAHEFIEKLPQGYQTLVGERGTKLSGGQRQRIAIARAFLKNAPILIFDEATSQLDSITEKKIQASFDKLMKGKTTLVVAHRLATLLKMDRILVFEKGKIIQDGLPKALQRENGLYHEMWKNQVGGFL